MNSILMSEILFLFGEKLSLNVERITAEVPGPGATALKVFLCVCALIGPQLDKARRAYHQVSRKEQAALEREAHAQGNPDVSIDKQKKIQEEREVAQLEAEKVGGHHRLPPPGGGGGERGVHPATCEIKVR